jgi:hypothetical protein
MYVMIRLLFCFLFFFPKIIFAQTKNFEFLGTIIGDNDMPYSYKLVFKLAQGKLSGYSICDIGGSNETKAFIEGTLNDSTGQISFKEKDLAYTKYANDVSNMCFIHAKGKLNAKKGKTEIQATFTGYYKNANKICDNGKIMLFSLKDVYSQLIQLGKVLNNKKNKDTLSNELLKSINPLKNVDDIQEVSNKGILRYNFNSNKVNMEIWDDGVEDNDRISISVNDSLIESNYKITKQNQILSLTLKPKSYNVIKITAENEGLYSPNTVKVILNDKTRKNLVLSRLSKGESFFISIKTE